MEYITKLHAIELEALLKAEGVLLLDTPSVVIEQCYLTTHWLLDFHIRTAKKEDLKELPNGHYLVASDDINNYTVTVVLPEASDAKDYDLEKIKDSFVGAINDKERDKSKDC